MKVYVLIHSRISDCDCCATISNIEWIYASQEQADEACEQCLKGTYRGIFPEYYVEEWDVQSVNEVTNG